jgi:hypothetical protein
MREEELPLSGLFPGPQGLDAAVVTLSPRVAVDEVDGRGLAMERKRPAAPVPMPPFWRSWSDARGAACGQPRNVT